MDPSINPGTDPTAAISSRLKGTLVDAERARRAAEVAPEAASSLGGAILGGADVEVVPTDPEPTPVPSLVKWNGPRLVAGSGTPAEPTESSAVTPPLRIKFSGTRPKAPATPTIDPSDKPFVSRIKHNPGSRTPRASDAKAVSDALIDDLLPVATTPVEKVMSPEEKAAAIQDRLTYLASISELRKLGRSGLDTWSSLLGGDIAAVSERLGVQVNGKKALHKAGARHALGAIGFGAILDTGHIDPIRDNPTGAYKFYHSFKNEALGEAYVTEVIRRAWEAKITLGTKSFDHDYDGINFYTSHFQELEAIIKDVYSKYKDAFGETEHFLQGEVEGVDSRHIGWVQETRNNDMSHSERMKIIGKALDNGGLNVESYLKGCEEAGVRPEAPWLFNDVLTSQIEEKAAKRQKEVDRIRAERAKAGR